MEVLRQESNNYLQEPIATGINHTCRATHRMFATTPRMQTHVHFTEKRKEVPGGEVMCHTHRENGKLDV